uniref:Diacylglycerol O-acyltransferase n=1 Tax=Rhizochromulina marina TaxID=1034831 RepID=A0A7S2RHP6_9STRA|mmetsp:Transcript_16502/g.48262  ORF Transcript_16502/g.48262 Transcript_16502/m.48262 type:complete len:225 (+) Transcript_16502:2-676(+)
MFLTHFLVLHATQNLFAELTRFADRQFYEDWWNVTTWAAFYRKWNGLVHDFIHSYLYSDLVEFVGMSKSTAMMVSFVLSAVVHEYIVAASLGFFFPILFVLFGGPGIWFMQLTKGRKGRTWNIFMWVMLATGQGLMMVLYFREYYSRLLRGENEDLHSFANLLLVPRSYTLDELWPEVAGTGQHHFPSKVEWEDGTTKRELLPHPHVLASWISRIGGSDGGGRR